MNEITTGEWIQIGLMIAIPILIALWVDFRLRGERRRQIMAHLLTTVNRKVSDIEELQQHLLEVVNYLIEHNADQEAINLKTRIRKQPIEGEDALDEEGAEELIREAIQIGARLTNHFFEELPDGRFMTGQRKWRRWTGF